MLTHFVRGYAVALHPEGVDRNFTVAENEKTPG